MEGLGRHTCRNTTRANMMTQEREVIVQTHRFSQLSLQAAADVCYFRLDLTILAYTK